MPSLLLLRLRPGYSYATEANDIGYYVSISPYFYRSPDYPNSLLYEIIQILLRAMEPITRIRVLFRAFTRLNLVIDASR